jgi:hypothetical protein
MVDLSEGEVRTESDLHLPGEVSCRRSKHSLCVGRATEDVIDGGYIEEIQKNGLHNSNSQPAKGSKPPLHDYPKNIRYDRVDETY